MGDRSFAFPNCPQSSSDARAALDPGDTPLQRVGAMGLGLGVCGCGVQDGGWWQWGHGAREELLVTVHPNEDTAGQAVWVTTTCP